MPQNARDSSSKKDIHNSEEEALEASLLAALYREECPDTMKLGEYQLGLLSETEQAQIKAHLDDCPHCQVELSRLDDFLKDDIPAIISTHPVEESGWLKGKGFLWRQLDEAKHVIIRVLDEALTATTQALQPPTTQLAYAGKRRSGKSGKISFLLELKEGIEDIEITIAAEEKRNDPDHCAVTVEVNIPSRAGWPNLGDTEVTLRRGESALQTEVTDAYGKAIFEDVRTEELPNLDFEITPSLEWSAD